MWVSLSDGFELGNAEGFADECIDGSSEGFILGLFVEGRTLGFDEELTEGFSVLNTLGIDDGSKVEDVNGDLLGLSVESEGAFDDAKVGGLDFDSLGAFDSSTDGCPVSCTDGDEEGISDLNSVGKEEFSFEGFSDFSTLGFIDGSNVGGIVTSSVGSADILLEGD